MKVPRSLSVLLCVLLVTGACAPAAAKPVSTPLPQDREWESQLAEYLARLNKLGFSGSVLVARHGEVILSQGYDRPGREGREPVTADTLFAIGSNTKPFTAAAVLKLQDQGLLNVNDPIVSFLPDVPEDKAAITLHQLLTHSSGLDHSGVFQGDFEQVDRDDAVARILKSALLFKPGSESSYSDYGYILLAAVIEKVSGSAYQDYLRKELFEPAGMNHTGWWGQDGNLTGQPDADVFTRMPGPYWSIMGAGGMVSTVSDLYRFHLALQQGRILSSKAREAYSTVHFRLDERGGEGYGWMVLDEPGRRMRAHAGATPQLGHNNVMRWYMDEDLFIAASSAGEEIKAEDVVPGLARIALDLSYSMPPEAVPVAVSVLDEYVGRYQIDPQNVISVSRKGDRLLLTAEGQQAFDLLFKMDQGQNTQAFQSAVVDYLNTRQDPQLEQWKDRVSQRLGPFKGFKVVGTAPLLGNGEPWTYVVFEFERGSQLTRWIVSPMGALEAALFDAEPPYLVFIPQGNDRFMPFSLNARPVVQELSFSPTGAGTPQMVLVTGTGQMSATKLVPAS